MKNRLLTLTLASLAAVVILALACNKNAGTTSSANSNPNHIPADQTVIASLQGRVVDESGVPVEGAAVTSGAATTSTDINGVFSFSNISMSSRFGFVKVVKQGYFTGSRSIITNPGASNYVNIQLMPKSATGAFPASTGGKIAVGTGDTAAFAPSSVVEASTGAAYTGLVTVYATYLNPTDPNLYRYMPGDLRGIGSDGNETALQSFGMIDVEMQDASGNPLQLASGQQATLTFTIPDSLLSVAPATVPLWYFNDTTGRWIQQGTAVKMGNTYVGQVGHFTFWNCDAYMQTVNFKVRVVDQYGNPLAYRYIQFTLAGYGTRGGYTDSTGYAQGLIPKGEQLLMQVLAECGEFVGGVNVGPALSDQDLGTVTVNIVHAKLTVTGTVVDCSNNPVDSGYVNVLVDGLYYQALVKNGAFSLPLSRCYAGNASVQLQAGDFSTNETSTVATITADSGAVNAGTLTACSVVTGQQYIDFTFKGINFTLMTPSSTFTLYTINYDDFSASNAITGMDMMSTGLTGPGTYNGGADSVAFQTAAGDASTAYHGPVTYVITGGGPVGSNLQGSFSGRVILLNGTDSQYVNGTFSVYRSH